MKRSTATAFALTGVLALTATGRIQASGHQSDAQFQNQLKFETTVKAVKEGASSVKWPRGNQLDENSSWEDIHRYGWVRQPKVQYLNIFIPVTSLCVDGENVRPNNPWVDYCTEPWDDANGNRQCSRWEKRFLTRPIASSRPWCEEISGPEGECRRWGTTKDTVALSYDLLVRGNVGGSYSFRKHFDIPKCEPLGKSGS